MTKKEQIQATKSILREWETLEIVARQSLELITRQKRGVELELESLGASNSTRKGREISDKMKLEIRAQLLKDTILKSV